MVIVNQIFETLLISFSETDAQRFKGYCNALWCSGQLNMFLSVIPNQNNRLSWAVQVYGGSYSKNTRLVSCNDRLLWRFIHGSQSPASCSWHPSLRSSLFFLLPPEIGLRHRLWTTPRGLWCMRITWLQNK